MVDDFVLRGADVRELAPGPTSSFRTCVSLAISESIWESIESIVIAYRISHLTGSCVKVFEEKLRLIELEG